MNIILPETTPACRAGAPRLLPDFLQPSIPTKSNAPWKNKEQRAADRAAKQVGLQSCIA
jgi:hypothetical protein